MADLLRAHAPRVALRGSSMGGFQAIHAARARTASRRGRGDLPGARGLLLARFLPLGPGAPLPVRREATGPWLESLDIYAAAASLGPRDGTAPDARAR